MLPHCRPSAFLPSCGWACARIILVLAACLGFWGCAAGSSLLDVAEKRMDPLQDALQVYFDAHGFYPTNLTILVEGGMIEGIPALPRGAGGVPLDGVSYGVSPDGAWYYLSFAYSSTFWFSVADYEGRYFLSFDGQWKDATPPLPMECYAAEYYAQSYRETASAESLRYAIDAMLEANTYSTNCIRLPRSKLTNALGTPISAAIDIPPRENGMRIDAYSGNAADGIKHTYIFVEEPMLRPSVHSGTNLVETGLLVRRIYLQKQGETSSQLYAECPLPGRFKSSSLSEEE